MCLAYLFKQLHEQSLSPALDLQAFIVDHQARYESTEEAQEVVRLLYRIGNLAEKPLSPLFPLIASTRNQI